MTYWPDINIMFVYLIACDQLTRHQFHIIFPLFVTYSYWLLCHAPYSQPVAVTLLLITLIPFKLCCSKFFTLGLDWSFSIFDFVLSQIRIQNEAMKKQSMILLTEAASDPKLMLALHEVEQLTQELETQKQKYEQEVQLSYGTVIFSSWSTMEPRILYTLVSLNIWWHFWWIK